MKLKTLTIIPMLTFSTIAGVTGQSSLVSSTEYFPSVDFSYNLSTVYEYKRTSDESQIDDDCLNTINNSEFDFEFDDELFDLDVYHHSYDPNLDSFHNDFIFGEIFPSFHLKNYTTLVDYINSEVEGNENYLIGSKDDFSAFAYNIASKLATLNFQESAFELLPGNKSKFTLTFPDNRSLRITKTLEPSEEFDNSIFYTYFENKEIVSANTNDLDEFVEGFTEYLAA